MFTSGSKNADLFLLVTVFYVVGFMIIVFKTLGYRSAFPKVRKSLLIKAATKPVLKNESIIYKQMSIAAGQHKTEYIE